MLILLDFFKASLTTLCTSNYSVFKNTYFQSFFLGLWISKKNVKTYLYVKKSQLFEKHTIFPIAMQEIECNTQNRKFEVKKHF